MRNVTRGVTVAPGRSAKERESGRVPECEEGQPEQSRAGQRRVILLLIARQHWRYITNSNTALALLEGQPEQLAADRGTSSCKTIASIQLAANRGEGSFIQSALNT